MRELRYRKNAGVVLFNDKGEVLVGERQNYPGNFQFPQGGLHANEQPLAGAIREFFEETGLNLVNHRLVYEFPQWLTYQFPQGEIPPELAGYDGQKQKWYLFFWNVSSEEPEESICYLPDNEEFHRLQWMQFEAVCKQIIFFKKAVYQHLFTVGHQKMREFLCKI